MVSILRAKRLLQGRTLLDIYAVTNIDPSRLSLAERGFKKLRDDEKLRLAKALGCNARELGRGQEVESGKV
jgi:transcriptional regulator with XRE-family HTH domain